MTLGDDRLCYDFERMKYGRLGEEGYDTYEQAAFILIRR